MKKIDEILLNITQNLVNFLGREGIDAYLLWAEFSRKAFILAGILGFFVEDDDIIIRLFTSLGCSFCLAPIMSLPIAENLEKKSQGKFITISFSLDIVCVSVLEGLILVFNLIMAILAYIGKDGSFRESACMFFGTCMSPIVWFGYFYLMRTNRPQIFKKVKNVVFA